MLNAFRKISGRGPDIAIDFGTSHTMVVDRGGAVIFDEPSICCFEQDRRGSALVAAGFEAKRYLGRVETGLAISRPMRNGVLADIHAASEFLRYATRDLAGGRGLGRLRAIVGVPADATQAERRALETAALDAGLARPVLVAEPLAAGIGASLVVDDARGRMIVECGAGITEAAVISLGGICVLKSLRGGSEELDRALSDHLRSKHRFRIGDASAERLKIALSEALSRAGEQSVEVSGLEMSTGRPATLALPIADVLPIWDRHVSRIVGLVRAALRDTPPELARDIHDDGLTLTGGAAVTGQLAKAIAGAAGVAVHVASQATASTGLGLGSVLREDGHRAG